MALQYWKEPFLKTVYISLWIMLFQTPRTCQNQQDTARLLILPMCNVMSMFLVCWPSNTERVSEILRLFSNIKAILRRWTHNKKCLHTLFPHGKTKQWWASVRTIRLPHRQEVARSKVSDAMMATQLALLKQPLLEGILGDLPTRYGQETSEETSSQETTNMYHTLDANSAWTESVLVDI